MTLNAGFVDATKKRIKSLSQTNLCLYNLIVFDIGLQGFRDKEINVSGKKSTQKTRFFFSFFFVLNGVSFKL